MENIKICKTCLQAKPIAEFRRDKRYDHLRANICGDCERDKCREYSRKNRAAVSARVIKWQKDNAKQHSANTALWRKKNPEKSKAITHRAYWKDPVGARKRDREKYWSNPVRARERTNATRRARYHADVEATREKKRNGYAANREYFKALVHASRCKKLGGNGRYSGNYIVDLLRLQRGRCAYCRANIRKSYCIDHIHSASKGGANINRNIQLTCKPCNSSKGAKDPIDFAQSRGRLL